VAQASKNATAMLRDLILAGALAAGSKLGEAELATRLDVSRTPVREALSRLAAEGLVELSPNRGARVASWTSEELREIFEVRLRLEPYAVSQAVPLLSPAEIDELGDLADSMLALGRDQALTGIVELNQRFHGLLIARAGSPALASALTSVTHAVVVRRNFEHYSPGALARSLAHHLEIVAAARAGEPDWAEAVMRSHLYNARATMLSDQAEEDQ
jgi:DNA-binding GntR family transcriptional regulator